MNSQDNKTTGGYCYCTCHNVGPGHKECGECCKNKTTDPFKSDPQEIKKSRQMQSHPPATDDLVEDAVKEYRKLFDGDIENGEAKSVEECLWLRSKLNFVISRTREERDKMAAKYGAERFSEGIREERERIKMELKAIVPIHSCNPKHINIDEAVRIIESGKSE
jgi:hypothetical protein